MAQRSHDARWANQRREAKREPPEQRRRKEDYDEYEESSYNEYNEEYNRRRYEGYGGNEEEMYESRNWERDRPDPRGPPQRETREKVAKRGSYNQETLDRPAKDTGREVRQREPEERRAPREEDARRGSRENILREARREPHLRFEPSPVPFHSHKQAPIDGYGQSPRQKDPEPRDPKQRLNRSQENASPAKFSNRNVKKEGPPATAAGSIRTIINNLRGQGSTGEPQKPPKDDGRNEIPRNKVSTNPFLRNGEKMLSPRNQPEQPKNVSDVVQKMNTGDWPIQIDEEEMTPPRPRSVQSFHNTEHSMSKAEQWETLDRKSPTDRRTHSKSPVVHRIERSQRNEGVQRRHSEVRELIREEEEEKKRQRSQESDHFSERSEGMDQTTVSTDSAMGSDPDNTYDSKMHLPFELPQGTILRKLPDNVKELNEEAEKLLVYFKGHRSVLNYLGIGLSETLWNHIRALPVLESDILVTNSKTEEKHSQLPKIMKKSEISAPLPQIKIQPPAPTSPKKNPKAPPPTFPKSAKSMQSPKLRALEQELCCTDAISEETYGLNQRDDNVKHETKGGRFVKKSAAALIAKKQGHQSLPEDAPVSSDFADPRIAAEIAQLKAREAELQRSRSELGLPTIDDVMDSWSGKSPRIQHNLDYMKQMSAPITKSQSSHSIMIDNHSDRNHSDSYYRNDSSRRSSIQYEEDGYYEDEHRMMMQRQMENRQYRVSPQNGQFFRDALQSSNGPATASKNVRHSSSGSGPQSHRSPVKRMDITVHTSRDSPATPQRYHRQVGL